MEKTKRALSYIITFFLIIIDLFFVADIIWLIVAAILAVLSFLGYFYLV